MTNFREMVETNKPGLFSQCIQSHSESEGTDLGTGMVVTSFDIDKTNYLCKACKGSMQRGKMSSNNGLIVDILPKRLKLTELKNNLIILNIIFQKVHKMPKSRWNGTHDRLVNIPILEQDI